MSIQVKNVKSITLGGKGVRQIKDNQGRILWKKVVDCFYIEAVDSNVEIKYITTANFDLSTVHLQYSFTGISWKNWSVNTPITLTNKGTKLYIKNLTNTLTYLDKQSSLNILSIVANNNKTYNVGGKIISLLNNTKLKPCCFYGLFSNNSQSGVYTNIVDASKLSLSSTQLEEKCYNNLFAYNKKLTKVPELPAINVPSFAYANMFKGCTSLNEMPNLPATSIGDYAYEGMFEGCSSLKSMKNILATSLGIYCCHNMFYGCKNLSNVLELPATTLAEGCYQNMFTSCIGLTDLSELNLSPQTLATSCFEEMFSECTNLILSPKLNSMELKPRCYNSMFRDCTSLLTVPELPATELAESCYGGMFSGCSSLTIAPNLSNVKLSEGCCEGMFYKCVNLVEISKLSLSNLSVGTYQHMFDGCKNLRISQDFGDINRLIFTLPTSGLPQNSITDMFLDVYGPFKGTPIAGHTYYWDLPYTHNLIKHLTHVTAEGPDTFYEGQIVTIKLTPESGYRLPDTITTVGIDDYYYNRELGEIVFKGPKKDHSDLPIEYQEVEWIKATSNYAYINTDVNGSNKVDLEIKAKLNVSSQTMCLIGSRTAVFANGGQDITWATPSLFYQQKGYSLSTSMTSGNVYHLKTDGSKLLNADTGATLVNLGTIPAWEIDKPIYIGCLNSNGTTSRQFTDEIYFAKLYKEGSLVRHLIPCYRKSDNKVGMFDLVTKVFYPNGGTGVFEVGPNVEDVSITVVGVLRDFTIKALEDDCEVKVNITNGTWNINLLYSLDGINWNEWPSDQFTILINTNEEISLRNLSNRLSNNDTYYTIKTSKRCEVEGDITSLSNFELSEFCYYRLFDNSNIVSAKTLVLPSTTVAGCYSHMFFQSKVLLKAPRVLPALHISLASYNSMFKECESLINVPIISATSLDAISCANMFEGCTSIIHTPELLSETLANDCYSCMFLDCVNLITAGKIHAKYVGSSSCYSMFQGCKSLIQPPEMMIELDQYGEFTFTGMFQGCSSLSVSQGSGEHQFFTCPLKTDEEFVHNMFNSTAGPYVDDPVGGGVYYWNSNHHTLLNFLAKEDNSTIDLEIVGEVGQKSLYIGINDVNLVPWDGDTPITLNNNDRVYIYNASCDWSKWVNEYISFVMTGKIEAYGNVMSLVSFAPLTECCFHRLFLNCESLLTAPELPATELAESCYQEMFEGCTSLTKAPELPAITLVKSCYNGMFGSCKSLEYTPDLTNRELAPYCYSFMFSNCSNINRITGNLIYNDVYPIYSLSGMFYNCSNLRISENGGEHEIFYCRELPNKDKEYTDYMFANTKGPFIGNPIYGNTYYWNGDTPSHKLTMLLTNLNSNAPTNFIENTTVRFKITPEIGYRLPDTINFDGVQGQYDKETGEVTFIGLTSNVTIRADALIENRYLCLTADESNDKISYSIKGTLPNLHLQISTDNKQTWTDWAPNKEIILKNVNDDVYIRNLSSTLNLDKDNRVVFSINNRTKARGYVTSLINFANVYPYCFYGLFSLCEGLITAPYLLDLVLKPYCYDSMFYGCSALTEMPSLPATQLAERCYAHMFEGSGITSSLEIPNATTAKECCLSMFENCYRLVEAGNLLPDNTSESCYESMFSNCPLLVLPPQISAKEFASYSCKNMFTRCFKLIETPKLQIQSVSEGSFQETFRDCLALKEMCLLPSIENLPANVFNGMFYGDIDLKVSENVGDVLCFTCPTLSDSSAVRDMFTETGGSFKGSPTTGNKYYVKEDSMYLGFRSEESNSTIGYSVIGTLPNIHIQTSTDKMTWNDWNGGTINLDDVGGKIYVKNLSNTLSTDGNYFIFKLSGKVNAFGNCDSMINFSELSPYCYCKMFENCTSLTRAPKLPTTTLASTCYFSMFKGCTSLVSTPELLADTLASYCYKSMFENCTSLTDVNDLPATTLASTCYEGMFKGCISLIKMPKLPALTLTTSCYSEMFSGCINLLEVEDLPATTLAYSCYGEMFENCTSLTETPKFTTAIAERCYANMFRNCTSLKYIAKLDATSLNTRCYYQMFKGCTSLKISEGSGDSLFLDCPSTSPSFSVTDMFTDTGGTFTGTPTQGNKYYWNE